MLYPRLSVFELLNGFPGKLYASLVIHVALNRLWPHPIKLPVLSHASKNNVAHQSSSVQSSGLPFHGGGSRDRTDGLFGASEALSLTELYPHVPILL